VHGGARILVYLGESRCMDTYFEYGREVNSASAQNLLVSPRLFVIGSPPANIPAPMISFEKSYMELDRKISSR